MNTFTILLTNLRNDYLRVWGISQRAYCSGRITWQELGIIQSKLSKLNFFKVSK